MRLHELSTNIRKSRTVAFKSDRDFFSFMRLNGFKKLGEGTFSAVFHHHGLKRVMKVVREDDAYMSFVEFCRQHRDNPHLPKLGRPIQFRDDVFVIGLEPLTPIAVDQFEHVNAICKEIEAISQGAEVHEPLEQDSFYKTLQMVYDEGQARNFLMDIKFNDENTMRRGDTLVITDPWVSRN